MRLKPINYFNEYVDLAKIDKYAKDKLISVKKHPTEDLLLLDYTQRVQFDNAWDEYTMQCRGLIVDTEGKIVSRGLRKFFNLSQIDKDQIPTNKNFKVLEKLDGSCIIPYFAPKEGKWFCATRGSFQSTQSASATMIIRENPHYTEMFELHDEWTFIFEYISPRNRIVVQYPEDDLVLLAILNTKTGEEINIDLSAFSKMFRVAKQYKVDSVEELEQRELNNDEGVVVVYPDGFRFKCKNKEYVRLHSLLTNFSNKDIWKCLKNGDSLEQYLEQVPDEFYDWVHRVKDELDVEYLRVTSRHTLFYNSYLSEYPKRGIEKRKEVAEKIHNLSKDHDLNTAILWSIYDEKSYDRIVWDLIKPSYQKPFTEESDI